MAALPTTIATGMHAADPEITDLQKAVQALLAQYGNGILLPTSGGTGLGAYAKGDLLYASGTNTLARLAAPADGSYLAKFTSGVPSWALPTYCAAEYTTTAAQSVTSGSFIIVNYATSVLDTDSAVTTGASWKFTCPTGKGGQYMVVACNALTSGAEGINPVLFVYKTPSGGAAAQYAVISGLVGSGAFGDGSAISGATIVTLAAGDAIDLRIFQNSGGTRPLDGVAFHNRIFIARLFGS